MNPKYSFSFDKGDGKDKALLGGKGANLCEMTQLGLNVPPGFVITTATCLQYLENKQLPGDLMDEGRQQITLIEQASGKQFGGSTDPLLVSVRSGSAISMPGMMDTILNLGLNKQTLAALIEITGDPRFAYDAYRRFIQLFGKVALGIEDEKFDVHFNAVKRYADGEHAPVVAVCAAIEAEIADMGEEDKAVFLADMGLSEPGLNRVISAGYALLGLQT